MEGRLRWDPSDPDRFARQLDKWRQAGASHVSVDTMSIGLGGVDGHLAALARAAAVAAVTRP
jgi:hypothetical protein